jgi:diguanylate cyclase (GGDEF)-like protein
MPRPTYTNRFLNPGWLVPMTPDVSGWMWRWYLLTVIVFMSLYPFCPRQWQTILFFTASMACGLAMVGGTRWRRPERPAPWYLLGAGHLVLAAGDAVYAVYWNALHIEPFPSPADGPYLTGYLLLLTGLVILVRLRAPGHDRAGSIDAAITGVGFGLLAWTFVMGPSATDSSLSVLGRLLSVLYPLVDVAVLVLLVRLVTTKALASRAGALLGAAIALQLANDAVFAVMNLLGVYDGGLMDVVWLASAALSGAAALHPSMHEVTRRVTPAPTGLGAGRLALLFGATLIAPFVIMIVWWRRDIVNIPVAALAAAVLFGLVLLRMAGLVRQIREHAGRLELLALVDGLTGAPNRRTWDTELNQTLVRARRHGPSVHVALIDLDHFKYFNDAYGHQAGDRLLREAVAAWRAHLRLTDMLARYGGEEFGVLLQGGTPAEAADVLDRLRRATPSAQTASIGMATWDGVATPEELVAGADVALYEAKRNGRNRLAIGRLTPATEAPAGERAGRADVRLPEPA